MTKRGGYTMGWLVAVLSLLAAREMDGHWFGAVVVLVAYVGGGVYVEWCRRRAEQRRKLTSQP